MSKKEKSGSKKIKIKKQKTVSLKKKKSDSILSDSDIKLLSEGIHFKIYEKLGARSKTVKKEKGVQFAVWAPDAKSVSVVGEFNDWVPGEDKMEKCGKSGYWQTFIKGLNEGEMYKYAVKSQNDTVVFKSDPYAFKTEHRPGNASVVYDSFDKYKWKDADWIKDRKKLSSVNNSYKNIPISIYEVHLGSWKKDHSKNEWGYKNYKELAHELVEYVKENNYTHIELLPVMEHPLDISWGYQVVNYFAPTSRYGEPEDFMYFVDHCHQNEIGVILDWVPSHFPTDEHGLGNFTGREIYAYENMQKGFHKEWGTYVFDYGRNEVVNFLISNALFWLEKYHIDGLRVDAVASMLYLDYSRNDGEWQPNIHGGNENLEAVAFIKNLNETVHKKHKGVLMIAEESSSWPGVTAPVHLGGLGFDMKWNMGWMHDILAYFSMDPVFRKFHHGKLTFAIWYAFNEKFLLPISHDEVVHLKKAVIEKMPGDEWQKFANARLLYGFMFAHPGKKLNFMGNEIAQYTEWNSEESLKWLVLENDYNNKFNLYFRELNRLYKELPAFHEVDFESKGFQWLDFSDSDDSVIGFMRYNSDRSEMLLFTFNMTPVLRENYVFGVPKRGFFKEIMNSNAEEYGGSGVGNLGGIHSTDEPRFDFLNSIKVTLPPLAMNVFKYESVESVESVESECLESECLESECLESEIKAELPKLKEVAEIVEEESDIGNESAEIVKPEIETDLSDNEVAIEISEVESKIEKELTEETKEKPTELSEEEDMEMKLKEIVNRIKKF
jgi:1,4-alpha-glucan branching enzyme